MAAGSAIVAIAFAGARYDRQWAVDLYWLGQVIIYAAPAAFLLLRKWTSAIEAAGVALLMPVTTFLVNQYYSPGQFRFLDEFEHVQTAQSILATHHLFHANTILPQSPQYPGLEIVTTSIVSITHLSITIAGLIVTGIAHVIFALTLYFLLQEIWARPRVAALAVVLYATGSHYQFFDSYFIYESIALPFLALSLLATVKMMKSEGSTAVRWGVAAVVCGAVTAICHHVTSYALVALLLSLVIAQLFAPSNLRSRGLPVVFVAVLLIVAFWDLGVATLTVSYFQPVVVGLLPTHAAAPARAHVTSGQPPRILTLFEYFSFAILLALTSLGARTLWLTRRSASRGAAFGLGIASLSLFVIIALREGTSNGSELASRGLTFVLIPVSFVGALVFADRSVWRSRSTHWGTGRRSVVLALVSTVAVVALAVGGLAGSWPNYYARLPGPFRVSAWERSVDHHNLDVAQWFADFVPPDQGVASDYSTEAIISALGHQAEPNGIAQLFLPLHFTSAQGKLARVKRVSFIVVDRRLSEQLPATGYYFQFDPESGDYSTPIPTQSLTKFNQIPGVSRVYADGTIVVYEIVGSAYYK